MKIAFQMDPMDRLNFASDSTWRIMLEAAKVGSIYHFTPENLFFLDGNVFARIQEVKIIKGDYHLNAPQVINLEEMNIIFIRQDPPYDMAYLTTTYLLERIADKTLIVNDPRAIRDFPEKLSILDYIDLIPPSLITYNQEEAKKFAKNYEKTVIKPLYSFAGNDVFCVQEGDHNLGKIINDLIQKYKAPVIVQKFLDEISQGDKRIILVDGEPVGGILRVPKSGDIRSNLACGGTSYKTKLTEREKQICEAIKPKLVENNLFLVGIDVIGGYLSEINVTSPTGIVALEKFYDCNISKEIIDKVIQKYNLLTYS
ncbi:MAG: glutathione synthase [Rickettsiales bacterium]|jgi:glutathione synthase|nr:glutathione synthase [Rickettsiales bacterium]